MKHLVVFTNTFPYGSGETFLETEVNYLSRSFDRVHIFPLKVDDKSLKRSIGINVIVHEPLVSKGFVKPVIKGLFNRSPIIKLWSHRPRTFSSQNWKSYLKAVLLVRSILSNKHLDRIFSQGHTNCLGYFYWGVGAAFAAPFFSYQSRFVSRVHGYDLYEERNHGYIPFRQIFLERINHIFPISHDGRQYLGRKYSFDLTKVNLCRLGVEDHGLSRNTRGHIKRIVSCSSVIPLKRVHLICEAMSILGEDYQWDHLGGGDGLEDLKAQAEVQLNGRVTYSLKGALSHAEVLKYYKDEPVDLFINVSTTEGVPVSVMEALSFGIPVMATDVGGTREILGGSGVLLPRNLSSELLADSIREFFQDRHQMKKRNTARLAWQQNCQASKNYGQFSTLLRSLLG